MTGYKHTAVTITHFHLNIHMIFTFFDNSNALSIVSGFSSVYLFILLTTSNIILKKAWTNSDKLKTTPQELPCGVKHFYSIRPCVPSGAMPKYAYRHHCQKRTRHPAHTACTFSPVHRISQDHRGEQRYSWRHPCQHPNPSPPACQLRPAYRHESGKQGPNLRRTVLPPQTARLYRRRQERQDSNQC